MTVTISTGWWLLPAAITVVAFIVAYVADADNRRPAGDYAAIGAAMASLFHYGAATIVSLIAWLIWSLA